MVTSRVLAGCAQALVGLLVTGLLSSAYATPSQASVEEPSVEIIVRYGVDAPRPRPDSRPWGAQCVDRKYRDRLIAKRAIGAGMWVVAVDPPVAPRVAERIARQIDRCPGVTWAEAPRLVLRPGPA
jgi:hypothetical protein